MANEAKFTPGPWSQEHRMGRGGMWNTEVFCAKGETIATLAWYPRPEVNGVVGTYRDDNARLIAAAPELLEALTRMCKNFPTDTDMLAAGWEPLEVEGACAAYDKARAAIAKAVGSPQ